MLHIDRHLVDAGQVLALDDAFEIYIAEPGHLHAHRVVEVLLGAQHKDVGLNAIAQHLLHGVLRRLCLQLAGRPQVGHVGEVNAYGRTAQFPFELTNSLQEWSALDVAYRATYLGDDKVVLARLAEALYAVLYLVGNVRHHLHGLAQVVAPALLVDHRLIDASRGHAVGPCGLYASETLIVTQVEVGLHAVGRHVALAMLIGIKRSRVDVDVRVELLDRNLIATRLQQFTNRGRNNAFTQR